MNKTIQLSQFAKRLATASCLVMCCASIPQYGYAVTSSASQQATITVSGTVLDELGEPVIGAAVNIKGSNTGSITNIDGEYTIAGVSPNAQLVVTYIGYNPITIDVKGRTNIEINLEPNSELLEEVVVVGYGTAKKETLTGSVAVVDAKSFQNKGQLTSPMEALQGQVPGLIVTRSSGAPGDESWKMNLRGSVSVNSTDPLVIIDGIAASSTSELNSINPSDIESINFLKDGAAAIYGSRAAGGVVLVTTKKGVSGNARVDYSGSATYRIVGLQPELLSVDDWCDGLMQARINDGYGPGDTWYTYAQLLKKYKGHYLHIGDSQNPFGTAAFGDVADFVYADDVNWLQSLFHNAWSTEHNLAISGGNGNNTYRISGRYMYDNSTLRYGNNSNTRFNLRVNDTWELSSRVKLESIMAYGRQNQVAPTKIGDGLTNSLPQPGLPLRTVNGKAYGWGTWGSPVAKLEEGGDNELEVNTINISETLRINIFDWLDFTGNFGYNYSSAQRDRYQNAITFYDYMETVNPPVSGFNQSQSFYEQTSSQTDFYSGSGYFSGHHKFAGKNNLTYTAGVQYEFNQYKRFGINITDIQPGIEVVNGSGTITRSAAQKYQNSNLSWFGRANYDYDMRYMLEFNFRYDGSSKFRAEKRWDFFWGTSLGWRLEQEAFLKDVSWLSQLKLRASYAEVGNQSGIGNYDGVQLYTSNPAAGAYIGGDLLSTITVNGTLASRDRTWERIKNYNAAIDFGFFNGSLTGTIEGFLKENNNMLVNVQYPGTLGIKAPTANRGKFKDYGVEISGSYNTRIGEVNINAGGSFTFARNELVDYGGTSVLNPGYTTTQQGYPLYSIFGLRYGGKIQNEEMLNAYLAKYYEGNGIGMPKTLRVGDNMYCDENGDGVLNYKDYIYLGNDQPEISYSFNLGANWKGFDINVIFQGAANRFIYRGIDNFTVPFRTVYGNFTAAFKGNLWSESNPDAYYAPFTSVGDINAYNYQASSLTSMDGRYIRLKNVSIGYSVPSALLKSTHFLTAARISVSGSDLWEWSLIKDGYDPEAARNPSGLSRFPFTRNITFGLNLSF